MSDSYTPTVATEILQLQGVDLIDTANHVRPAEDIAALTPRTVIGVVNDIVSKANELPLSSQERTEFVLEAISDAHELTDDAAFEDERILRRDLVLHAMERKFRSERLRGGSAARPIRRII